MLFYVCKDSDIFPNGREKEKILSNYLHNSDNCYTFAAENIKT